MNYEKLDNFKIFAVICCLIGFLFLIVYASVFVFGIPNFSNTKEQRNFCIENEGLPIEPARENYNQLLCVFDYEGFAVEYGVVKITNKELQNKTGSYCFTCWDSASCSSGHNEILRKKGVHC